MSTLKMALFIMPWKVVLNFEVSRWNIAIVTIANEKYRTVVVLSGGVTYHDRKRFL